MAYDVVLTAGFRKELKHIAKKHRQILSDITSLIDELSKTPEIGSHLGKNVYKIRLGITGTSKGKSEDKFQIIPCPSSPATPKSVHVRVHFAPTQAIILSLTPENQLVDFFKY